MVDLVGTCPQGFWREWIAEGDPAGTEESGEEWAWFTRHSLIRAIKEGDRFYVVAHGRLRGYAPVTRVVARGRGKRIISGQIIRRGGAVAVTIPDPIAGFQGLRRRWWHRDAEIPFPDWREPGRPAARPPGWPAPICLSTRRTSDVRRDLAAMVQLVIRLALRAGFVRDLRRPDVASLAMGLTQRQEV